MTAKELYEQNRVYYAEDWDVSMPPWEDLAPVDKAAWNAVTLEYIVKALADREEDDDHNHD